ncbi:zinc metallopeptidase [Peptoclostridium sp. AF21-18]|uniref:zinc metallopeptidase n=1 Tax=Peptoclostridium sp. AF21-18 TaxID=2292243 RepID=UPI000E5572E2|nr:zinc metallopeptidase [Peptoclostridium sp. AF21-18]RHQ99828.1 peptidase [Peptoclostridium sp. AF21-18]
MMPYYGMGMLYDPTMMILIPAILFTMYAQFKVSSTTNRFFRIKSRSGYNGQQTAERILAANGIRDVRIVPIRGTLTDHYDPRRKVLRLSEEVYYGTSITSVAVAAHECGHALQHAYGYAPLTIRGAIVPVVNFASSLSWILIFVGLFFSGNNTMLQLGILMFSATVIFQLITLPVEFNASSRALVQLQDLGIVDSGEAKESRKVLSAAAMTYVAAALTAILQLARLLLIANNRDD